MACTPTDATTPPLRGTWLGLVALGALLSGGCAGPVPVLHDDLDEVYYTRTTLVPDGEDLYSSNYLADEGGYPPGSEAQITMFSAERVDLSVEGIPHRMHPLGGAFDTSDVPAFVDKYFVAERTELGLVADDVRGDGSLPASTPRESTPDDVPDPMSFRMDRMKGTTASSIERGVAAIGMSKAQVYMALGPPTQVNFGNPTVGLSRGAILESNRWLYWENKVGYYLFGLFPRVYIFQDGVLARVEE